MKNRLPGVSVYYAHRIGCLFQYLHYPRHYSKRHFTGHKQQEFLSKNAVKKITLTIIRNFDEMDLQLGNTQSYETPHFNTLQIFLLRQIPLFRSSFENDRDQTYSYGDPIFAPDYGIESYEVLQLCFSVGDPPENPDSR